MRLHILEIATREPIIEVNSLAIEKRLFYLWETAIF